MPEAVWRTSPARSISRWLAICASVGVSLSVGTKLRDRRMAGPGGSEAARKLAAPTPRRQSAAPALHRNVPLHQPATQLTDADDSNVANNAAPHNQYGQENVR